MTKDVTKHMTGDMEDKTGAWENKAVRGRGRSHVGGSNMELLGIQLGDGNTALDCCKEGA